MSDEKEAPITWQTLGEAERHARELMGTFLDDFMAAAYVTYAEWGPGVF